jgi:hypothetical protein
VAERCYSVGVRHSETEVSSIDQAPHSLPLRAPSTGLSGAVSIRLVGRDLRVRTDMPAAAMPHTCHNEGLQRQLEHLVLPSSVSALHVGVLVRAVHVVRVPHEIPHFFIEFRNTTTITVHDDSQVLRHMPNR